MKAIIFDMDGLMIDSEKLYFEAEREIAKEFNKKVDDTILWKMMGRSPLNAMEIFKNDLNLPVSSKELLARRDRVMIEKYKNDIVPMEGLNEIIQEFHKKKKLAIATGSQKLFLDITVDKLNIRRYFEVLQSSDNIKNGKPDPEIYLTTIKKLGIKPEECIVLEDSSNGSLAGKKAGCYTIAVISEYTKDQDFSFVDYKVNNLIEVIEHINNLYKN